MHFFVSHCFAMLHTAHAPNRARTCQEMAPRGLKAALKKPNVKLSGAGKFKGYVRVNADGTTGRKLKGVTKALARHVFSEGALPWGGGSRIGWRGKGGGRRRGSAVDSQLSRIVNSGSKTPAKFRLTRMGIAALKKVGLEPVVAQRAVASGKLGTAADIVAYHKKENRLVIVEVKCGFSDVRHAPATKNSRKCNMRAPLAQVADCALHRHFAQLLVTREMLARDKEVKDKLKDLGLETDLSAVLLYLDDDSAEIFELPEWWVRRGAKLLKVVGG